MGEKKEYTVLKAGWADGLHREEGASVFMTKKAARYLEMSGQIEETKPKRTAPARSTRTATTTKPASETATTSE